MANHDGNGWIRCGLGHRHWGRFGAAGLLAYAGSGPGVTPAAGPGPGKMSVLLQRRNWWGHHGGTWGLPGGALDSHETAIAAALREAAEECAVPAAAVRVEGIFHDDHIGWAYDSVLALADGEFDVHPASEETLEARWVPAHEVTSLDLHPGLAEHWAALAAALVPVTLIVDAANVMGSRPDGWWRDRAGAALRLRDELAWLAGTGLTELPASAGVPPLSVWLPDIMLVVEGAARPAARAEPAPAGRGQPAGGQDKLQVIAAPGSGDDTIAALARELAGWRIVVTADRELRSRCLAAGAAVVGPGRLLSLLNR
ncbi:MAG: NUDIX domain-containing protein [Streptosporangiaceae bacterium]|jgi:8-oxo-dGTP pyrophosphatase MutT (NUDIX family)